jgi:YebC/PmpR family DNA-binding regulatory protein
MSGHSHWASIKHKKGAADAKRGRMFSKLAKVIQQAARAGGGNPDANLALRMAIDKAKENSMPKDAIERSIKKGTGELAGETLEELMYEGYGPGGVAIEVMTITDNRNRTAAALRKIFEMHGGKMAAAGAVAWQFEKKGLIVVDKAAIGEDELMDLALDAGADDLKTTETTYEVTCPVAAFENVKSSLASHKIATTVAEIGQVPKSTVKVDADNGRKLLRLLEDLEEQEDSESVHSNFEMDDAVMAEFSKA